MKLLLFISIILSFHFTQAVEIHHQYFKEFTNEQETQLLNWRNEFLKEIEELFGERDLNFILGEKIYYHPLGPRTYASNNIVNIALGGNVMMSSGQFRENLAKWQLAHECIHLLDPVNDSSVSNVLEEGLAVWFQNKQLNDDSVGNVLEEGLAVWLQNRIFLGDEKYQKAEELFKKYSNKLIPKIRILRMQGVSLKDITKEQLLAEPYKIDSQEDVEILVEEWGTFYYR